MSFSVLLLHLNISEEGSRLEKGETQTDEKYCGDVHLSLNTYIKRCFFFLKALFWEKGCSQIAVIVLNTLGCNFILI